MFSLGQAVSQKIMLRGVGGGGGGGEGVELREPADCWLVRAMESCLGKS